jgi:hypothetical protein
MTRYFSIGFCAHGNGGCQAAAAHSSRAQVVSPDYTERQDAADWPSGGGINRRRCPSCRRPIAAARFALRAIDDGELHSRPA